LTILETIFKNIKRVRILFCQYSVIFFSRWHTVSSVATKRRFG